MSENAAQSKSTVVEYKSNESHPNYPKNGTHVLMYSHGTPHEVSNWEDGKRHGSTLTYNVNGEMSERIDYENGLRICKFTGIEDQIERIVIYDDCDHIKEIKEYSCPKQTLSSVSVWKEEQIMSHKTS